MKREALVPVDDEIVDGIGRQQQRNAARWPGGTPALFPRPTKNIDGTVPANGDAYRGGLRRWLARCDIRGQDGSPIRLTPHQFRHSLGTTQLKRKAIECCAPPAPGPERESRRHASKDIIQWLEDLCTTESYVEPGAARDPADPRQPPTHKHHDKEPSHAFT